MGNSKLNKAKNKKNNEFYTLLIDIKREVNKYPKQFKDKIVMLPCDDIELLKGVNNNVNKDKSIKPEETMSQFWVFFHLNYKKLGLKGLIVTAYSDSKIMYKVEYYGKNDNDLSSFKRTPLQTNGDFRNDEVKEIIKKSDIIVTNPPFSLFREFVNQLIELDKKFLIIGPVAATSYMNIVKYMKQNKLWLGTQRVRKFLTPTWEIKQVSAIWYTNLENVVRNKEIVLEQKYNKKYYPKYDNYDAINVDRTKDIPRDYFKPMGVPITFLEKFNPNQFEIIGCMNTTTITKFNFGYPYLNGKRKYPRIIIKRKKKVKKKIIDKKNNQIWLFFLIPLKFNFVKL